jgi:hypothetical protein
LIFPLAKSAIEDLHVKLRRPDMEVERHEKTLTDVMVLRKLCLASPEVLFAVAIIPYLHLIWDAAARLFTENSFS